MTVTRHRVHMADQARSRMENCFVARAQRMCCGLERMKKKTRIGEVLLMPSTAPQKRCKFKIVYTDAFVTESLETLGGKRWFSDIISK